MREHRGTTAPGVARANPRITRSGQATSQGVPHEGGKRLDGRSIFARLERPRLGLSGTPASHPPWPDSQAAVATLTSTGATELVSQGG